jgi:UDPglucose 6-dehydrogenase
MKIGIVGYGFVGSAIDFGFKCEKLLIDPKLGTKIEDLIVYQPDAVFISVPTPMNNGGSVNASIVIETTRFCLDNLSGYVIIKSTVTPDIIKSLSELSGRVIYNPEFLTEVNHEQDFIHPNFHLFGTKNEDAFDFIDQLYFDHSICSNSVPVYSVTPEEASFIKYGLNCFLASKVLWMNQFYDVISKTKSSYDNIRSVMEADPRIGRSHMQVPGPDEKKGFGGACFKKDGNAFSEYSKGSFTVLSEVIKANDKIRSQYELDPREREQNVTYQLDLFHHSV